MILENTELFENFFDYTMTGICVFRFDEQRQEYIFVFCNPAFYAHNNFLEGDVIGKSFPEVFPMSLENGMYAKVKEVDETGKALEHLLSYYNEARGMVYQQFQMFKLSHKYVITMFNDITEIKKSENIIKLEQIKYSQTINSLTCGVITTDEQKKVTLMNKYAYRILELPEDEDVTGEKIEDLYTLQKTESDKLLHKLVDGFDAQTILCRNGSTKLVVPRVVPLFDSKGDRHGYVFSFDDVSNFVKTQEELMYLNYHDTLTKFYNRNFLSIYLANNTKETGVGVIYADVNGLSKINEARGSNIGDDVLKKCAQAFQHNLSDDTILVRFGEDDFIAIVFLRFGLNLTNIANRISSEFARECKDWNTTLSIGTSVVGVDAQDIRDAISISHNKMNAQKIMSDQSIRSSALSSLMAALQAKSYETEEHAQRLNDVSQLFAKKLKLDERDMNHLALLSVLHDVGKIGVPEYVLDKPGKLTNDEWKIMRNHTNLGYRILMSTPGLEEVAPLVRSHHERWDGAGYPDGLKETEIPLLSRMISLVDSYDAMTNDRVYRGALSQQEAIDEILKNSGKQFDPHLVDIFLQSLNEVG